MRILGVFLAVVAAAQTSDIAGVWKANPEKSKLAGQQPGPGQFLMWIEQSGPKIVQHVMAGPERINLTHFTNGEAAENTLNGVKATSRARWDGSALVIEVTFPPGTPAPGYDQRIVVAPDKSTMTVTHTVKNRPAQTMVLDRADDLLEEFKKPEKTAREALKNVKVLEVPASSIYAVMTNFAAALGVQCDHCHVPNQFEKDDKPAKVSARKMIVLTRELNRDQFSDGKVHVSCYTCHRGEVKPKLLP
jgi:hypothetical protein